MTRSKTWRAILIYQLRNLLKKMSFTRNIAI